MPRRIQRRRTKGWRMPEGAVYVGRPTKWGNPFRPDLSSSPRYTPEDAVMDYREDLRGMPEVCEIARAELRGKDLVCWCPLVDAEGRPVPCHAEVLLEVANS